MLLFKYNPYFAQILQVQRKYSDFLHGALTQQYILNFEKDRSMASMISLAQFKPYVI